MNTMEGIKGNQEKLEEISPIFNEGMPTEKGWYLLKHKDYDGHITYNANYLKKGIKGMEWKYYHIGDIIGWQKIEAGE